VCSGSWSVVGIEDLVELLQIERRRGVSVVENDAVSVGYEWIVLKTSKTSSVH
jgi:hypothetical protein